MLDIVTYFWRGGRADYKPEHVNLLRRMVARHYKKPHRFTCVTNHPEGLDRRIRVIPDTEDFATTHPDIEYYKQRPRQSCFRRLRHWQPHAAKLFGRRIVTIDIDVVIVGNLAPIFDRQEDVVLLRGSAGAGSIYNGTLQILNAGARPHVWNDFDPDESPNAARRCGFGGTDQAWLSFILGPHETTIGREEGVYKFSHACKPPRYELPSNARIVHFAGPKKPWDLTNAVHWIKDLYQ